MASSSTSKRIYDAFLSFRGADQRNNFLGHLYKALVTNGIYTFRDSEEMKKGDLVSSALMMAIEESCIAIIVFSENYASSFWCLEELAKIMECKEQKDLTVLPIFYKVDPGEVRMGRERYGRALAKHEAKFGKDSEKVKRWKKALFDAGSLSGWHLNDGDESELIQNIVKEISTRLDRKPLHVAKYPVGIDSQVVKLTSMLNLESDDDVVMVGLWGQGGIGKTTIARALYNAIFKQFQGSCFLANVREASKNCNDLVSLQGNLLNEILLPHHRLEMFNVHEGIHLIRHRLCNKKVLIVLDDVDNPFQLSALAGESKWFGNGSRIIITTRDKHLLTSQRIDQDHVYEVKRLDDIEARELLCKHTLMRHQKLEIRTDLVDRVLNYVEGLPLALEVLGSLLRGRSEDEWESALEKLTSIPNNFVNEVLKISYDGLEDNDKEIFLDIACFFNRRNSEYVKRVLNSCDFQATMALEVLIEKSLVSIDESGLIKVPNLIQLMGMDTVRQECHDDPRRRSRLWLYDDVVDVLSRDMGGCAVKAIVLEPPEPMEICIDPDTFTKMRRLRLLIMRNVHNSFQGPICFPNGLRWFEWPQSAPLIPKVSSNPKNSVELGMSKCGITVKPKQFKTSVATIGHVIGIDDRVKDVIKLLDIEDDKVGVRIVGIHGTAGIGKTTIAKAVYDRLSSCFDSCSFLAEIGETAEKDGGIQLVQTKLMCDILDRDGDVASFKEGIKFFLDVFRSIKVLIVLDDVEDQSHLNDLVGDRLDWFGPGSRIIVTSENGEILQEYVSRRLAHIYEVNGMVNDQALELLCKHAAAIRSSIPDYLEAVKRIIKATGQVPIFIEVLGNFLETAKLIIKATGQVPFVIEVIGSFLRGKPLADWWEIEGLIKPQKENSQERLKDRREILKICYEALHEKQKQIFWDIAWFANGEDSRIASYMWPNRDPLPSHHVLMPLAKIGGDNMLWMHKLLKRLSRTIDQDVTIYLGRRSRQYMHVTHPEVINWKEGMEELEALCFDSKNLHPHTFTETDFKRMRNLRFLKLDNARMMGNFSNVFPKLRWLSWQGCPRDFKATEFNLTELVILDLSWSKVTEDWGDWRLMKMEQLRVLNLTGCTDLLISPTFSSFPNLEILILERCSRLVHLDPSIGGLKKLLCLNLKSCTELNMLPAELDGLEALKELLIDETSVRDIPLGGDSNKLEILSASNCLSLSLLPPSFEYLTSLSILSLDNSKIIELPDEFGELVKLRHLSLRNCHWIRELPESIGQLEISLEELDISGTGVSELPDSFRNLRSLKVLKMDYCFISKFPSSIWCLRSLEEIHASSCTNLEGEIPGDIEKLINLRILKLRYSPISSLPPEIKYLSKLETLDLLKCDMLHELPALPSGLFIVHLSPKLKEKVSNLLVDRRFIIM